MVAEDTRWIETPDGLEALARALGETESIALDTESNSMFAYRERICLLQLHLIGQPTALWAIDPLALPDIATAARPLVEWLALGRRVLVHGGEYDVAVLKCELGVAPANLYDTQAAASMLGIARTGYANLCGDLLDVKLSKEHQQFDWARRPVPAAARRYAMDDVRYLPALAAALSEMVREADLEEEVAIACGAVADALPHETITVDAQLWRVAGRERLTPEELGRLFSLIAWREGEAERRDQPPGRLVSKHTLVELARRAPTSPQALGSFGLSRRLIAESAEPLLAALRSPMTPPERPRRPRVDPAIERRQARLKAWRQVESERRGVTAQAVLPTRALEALALGETDLHAVPQLGDKRIRLYGAELLKLIGS